MIEHDKKTINSLKKWQKTARNYNEVNQNE